MLRTIIASTVSSAVKTHTNKGYVGTFSRAVLAMLLLGLGSILVVTTPGSVAGAQGAAVSFDQPKQIVGTPNQDAEPPQIAASGKNVYIIWHEFPEETAIQPDVFLARSTNHGKDFGARKNLSNSADIDSSNERIATSGHKVFVVWSENADEIFFRRSTNRGENFDSAKKLSISPGATLPQVAVSGKNVFVVWQAPDQNGISDIFFTQSSDEGRNFDIEENISNNDGESEFRDHGLRQIAVSGDKVIVTWRDSTGGDFEIFFIQGK